MNQFEYDSIIQALKAQLKKSHLKYQDVADELSVSLTTVKRIFQGEDCNLGRIMDICELAGVRFFDLVELAKSQSAAVYFLTEEQETFFAADPSVFAVFRLVHRGWTKEEICEELDTEDKDWRRMVRALEKLGLVERLAGDKVRSVIGGQIRWSLKGPMSRKIMRQQNIRFMDDIYKNIENPDHCFMANDTFLSADSAKDLVAELQMLGRKFRARSWREERLMSREALQPVRLLVVAGPYKTRW